MSRRLVLDDGRSQRELVLRERMTVGRNPGCDISDSDPRLSRRHAEFLATASGLVVRDLESRNGVRVNGRTVPEATLSPGDLVEIAHLRVRFLDDSPAEPAGVALPTTSPAPVGATRCGERIERRSHARAASAEAVGDRFRPHRHPARAGASPGGRAGRPPVRDAGDVAISALEGTVRIAVPRNAALKRNLTPRPRLGVQDLMTTGWGLRVLGQGAVLAGIVFLMITLPTINWATSVAGPIDTGLLVRMLAAPLLASLFLGLIVASLIARTTARGLERDDDT